MPGHPRHEGAPGVRLASVLRLQARREDIQFLVTGNGEPSLAAIFGRCGSMTSWLPRALSRPGIAAEITNYSGRTKVRFGGIADRGEHPTGGHTPAGEMMPRGLPV